MVRTALAVVYAAALISIILTRVFKQFTLAEGFAVLAFLAGLVFWRLSGSWSSLSAFKKIVAVGCLTGIFGLFLKLSFVALGIGDGHDNAHPLVMHIHHLFFNLGFVCLLVALGVAAVSAWRGRA